MRVKSQRKPDARAQVTGRDEAEATSLLSFFVSAGSRALGAAAWVVEKEMSLAASAAQLVEDGLRVIDSVPSRMKRASSPGIALELGGVVAALTAVSRAARDLLSGRVSRIVNISTTSMAPDAVRSSGAPNTVQIPGPLSCGQTGERALLLNNERNSPTEEFMLVSSDLLSASGARIGAACVSFEPPSLTIAAHGSGRAVVGVTIPENTPSGNYIGLLRWPGLQREGVLLQVDVG